MDVTTQMETAADPYVNTGEPGLSTVDGHQFDLFDSPQEVIDIEALVNTPKLHCGIPPEVEGKLSADSAIDQFEEQNPGN